MTLPFGCSKQKSQTPLWPAVSTSAFLFSLVPADTACQTPTNKLQVWPANPSWEGALAQHPSKVGAPWFLCSLCSLPIPTAAQQKCAVCAKTVYPMEFIGASDKAFHKNCFRCCVCKTKLLPTAYATVNERIFCNTHYDAAFKAGGGTYSF